MIEERQADVSSVRAMVLKQFWSKIEKFGPPGHQIEMLSGLAGDHPVRAYYVVMVMVTLRCLTLHFV